MDSTLEYFKNDELALHAWTAKYQLNDENINQFFERITNEFDRLNTFKVDKLDDYSRACLSDYGKSRKRESFGDLFKDFKYIIPGGSVLAGLGSKKPVSLSNCFVVDNDDSIDDIFGGGRDMAQIYKRRGGVGLDLSKLRPKGAPVNNAAKTTSGVVPFMELYSQITNTIGQEGRRGALMLSIDINHPDSPDFVVAKQDLTKVTGANVSVRVNDEFMKAVETDSDYILRWPCNKDLSIFSKEYLDVNYNELTYIEDHTDNNSIIYIKKIKAKELWDSIIHCAWNTAEPGILFWSNIINNDPAGVYDKFKAVSTNPCGEIPLAPYDACRLIASNLYSLVVEPFTPNARIDRKLAYEVFYEAQVIADTLVELELEYVQRIIDSTEKDEKSLWMKILEIGKSGRRTGTGITALADMLAALGSNYYNIEIVEDIMKLKMAAEIDATVDLAIINGPFPDYNPYLEYENISQDSEEVDFIAKNNFFKFLKESFPLEWRRMRKHGRRNISWSTIAPTGTISIMAGTSSGCEPVFSIYYTRRKKCNSGETPDFIDQNGVGFKNYNVVHPKLEVWYNENRPVTSTLNTQSLSEYSKEELDELIKTSPWYKNTAPELKPDERAILQSVLQKYTTHSISSTVNVDKDVDEKFISTIYTFAHSTGCKGITVYREGSRSGILVREEPKKVLIERPHELDCKVLRFKNEDKKNWISFISIYNDRAYEIFTGINDLDELPIPSYIDEGKILKVSLPEGSRYDFSYIDKYGYTNTVGGLNRVFNKEYWNYARFVSALLRQNTPIEQVIKVIEGLSFSNKGMNSIQAGLIRSLKVFIPDGTKAEGAICENCGSHNIIYEGGCMICHDCGSSKCG